MQTKPILSCAGREAVSIDAALLNELLINSNFKTIGVQQCASQLLDELVPIANGQSMNPLTDFKAIIINQFLYLQLREAQTIARNSGETVVSNGPCDDSCCM